MPASPAATPPAGSEQAVLDDWIGDIERSTARRRVIASSLASGRSGVLSLPVRFALKAADIGPRKAVRLAFTVLWARIGRR